MTSHEEATALHSAGVQQPPFRYGNAVALIGLLLALPLALVFPHWTAWESGLWESLQNFVLLTGFLWALAAVPRLPVRSHRALLVVAAMFWLVFLGREMAWGAVLTPPLSTTEWGEPVWSSRTLWYRPWIAYIVGAMALVAVYMCWRHRVPALVLRVVRVDRQVLYSVLLFVLCMVVGTHAEGHGFFNLEDWYGMQSMVLEELVELLAYACLWMAQARVLFACQHQLPALTAAHS